MDLRESKTYTGNRERGTDIVGLDGDNQLHLKWRESNIFTELGGEEKLYCDWREKKSYSGIW